MNQIPYVKFLDMQCRLQFARYPNGRVAVSLVSQEHEPIARATVNVPEMPLQNDQVLIKDYAENAGILSALEAAGIVRRTGVRCQIGRNQSDVCHLLVTFPTVH